MARGKARQIIFRIFYSTSFTAVFILLIIFSAVTPADTIYESYKRTRLIDIFLIAGVYVFTALAAALIYASRLYTNRSTLKDIPKTFMPIEKEDLPGRRVHRLIQECLERSAVIAYQARPRSKRIEIEIPNAGTRMMALTKSKLATDQSIEPGWGKIAHCGWSSPASQNLPGLEYATVVDELVDLVEAKAVSLAPVNPRVDPNPDGTPAVDPHVIEEIARSRSMGMRAYLHHLIDIGVVPNSSLTVAFLAAYERARYSAEPISDGDFQALMRLFAEVLRNMSPVDIELLELDDNSGYQSDENSLSRNEISSEDRRKLPYHQAHDDTPSSRSTYSASGSVRHNKQPPRRVSEDSAPSLSSYDDIHQPPDDEYQLSTTTIPHALQSDEDDESLHSAAFATPRPGSRPRPSQRSSATRMYSAMSRQTSRPSESSSLHSDTGSVVRYELEPQASRSSRSSRHRVRHQNGRGVISLARGDNDRSQGSEGDLPYQMHVPSTPD